MRDSITSSDVNTSFTYSGTNGTSTVARYPFPSASGGGTCPSCGRCPTCGRHRGWWGWDWQFPSYTCNTYVSAETPLGASACA